MKSCFWYVVSTLVFGTLLFSTSISSKAMERDEVSPEILQEVIGRVEQGFSFAYVSEGTNEVTATVMSKDEDVLKFRMLFSLKLKTLEIEPYNQAKIVGMCDCLGLEPDEAKGMDKDGLATFISEKGFQNAE